MKVSFNEAEQLPAEESQALVPVTTEKALAVQHDPEIDRSDLVTPTLNVVAKVGDLSNIFEAGSIVLDKTVELVKKDQPLDVIAVSITKSYQEDTEFGEDMGERASTLAEVRAKGGQIEDRDGDNFWVPVARIIFLVKKTDNVAPEADPFFYHEIGGAQYLLAQMYVRKSAYTTVAKPLFTLRATQGSVFKLGYKMISNLAKFSGNTWWRPSLRPNGKPSEAEAEFINTLPV